MKHQFIGVNCGAIPEQLLKSELFGYEEGVFTEADVKGKPGYFKLANHGMIFSAKSSN
ncbi:sigma 54-interacting transcriptional regulator [Domibacillus iocasae]|uniref:sigma 54-interacting transcriptional regulator n=1 Tax=Domibacillus iocasae TaxID=1714016 RepID=UPI0009F198D5